jgi:hypothetical protein
MSIPGMVQRVSEKSKLKNTGKKRDPSVGEKIRASKLGKKNPKSSAWHRANNCMQRRDSREKMSLTLQMIGHKPKIRGGNGKGPTKHEAMALSLLGEGWVYNHVVLLERHPYKVDVANPLRMVAIEIDGHSHNSLVRREQDERKDRLLRESGWKVLRLKNQEVESFTISKLEDILAFQ